jgi:SnoaL-like domain
VLVAAIEASTARDAAGLAACYAEDAAWLADGETVRGAEAPARHAAVAAVATEWAAPQQLGAKAVLRWARRDEADAVEVHGAIVVEVRRGRIIFAAVA